MKNNNTHTGIMSSLKLKVILAIILFVVGISATGAFLTHRSGSPVKISDDSVLATVNGERILDPELVFMPGYGAASKSDLVDNTVTQMVLAQEALKNPAVELQHAINFAKRDILARGYVERKSKEIAAAITANEIDAYYRANLSAGMFNKYKLKFLILPTSEEADAFAAEFQSDKKTAVAKMTAFRPAAIPATNNPPAVEWVRAGDLPYGMGTLVATMKKSELSGAKITREGFIMMFLEDIEEGRMPKIAEVGPEIRRILLEKHLKEEILALRKKADIRLK